VEIETFLGTLNMTKLLNYEGSLTTPGCNEIVEWNVIVDPQPISTAQLQFFQKKWATNTTFAKGKGNNRATQAIGDRTIYLYGGEAHEGSGAGSLVNMMMSGFVLAILAFFA
jgi:carbonic anhydrase